MGEPLLISTFLAYAAENHATTEIVTREISGEIMRYTYADADVRCRSLAAALRKRGYGPDARIASLAWNTRRHFEMFYAVPGTGAAFHTVNPRLFEDQIAFIINDAQDECLFVDLETLKLAEAIAPKLNTVREFVIMAGEDEMPQTSLPNVLCYESLVKDGDAEFEWPVLDERSAAIICYTSGTTGNPKGVVYSHRAVSLQSIIGSFANMPTGSSGERQVLFALAPMFHANAWNFPFIGPLIGAKLVFPGRDMTPASLYELIETEGATRAAGVPSIWLILIEWLKVNGKKLTTLRHAFGAGSTLPPALLQYLMEEQGLEVMQSWGMTEVPNGSSGTLKPGHNLLPADEQMTYRSKSGRAIFGSRLRIVDDAGKLLPRDGKSVGHLRVRGFWAAGAYLNQPAGEALDADGWLQTGDLATIDADGYIEIVDRSKDVIKSGGEWISSVQLERIALKHEAVSQAAAIAVPHEKWAERPLLVVVLREGFSLSAEALKQFMLPYIARWWLPEEIVFVEALPATASGKINKAELRKRYAHTKPSMVGQ